MLSKWDKYSRFGLDVASTATSIGFSAAKSGTRFGFFVARGIASTAASLTGGAVDHALFGGNVGAGPILGGVVSTAISAIESVALAPILIGETFTSTSLVAAQSSLSVLQTIYPGSDEASFSLANFVTLVRREWSNPVGHEELPQEKYGIAEVMKALVAWATLQGITSRWQEKRWFTCLTEIHVNNDIQDDASGSRRTRAPFVSQVHVTADVIYPSHSGQIITADVGEAPLRATNTTAAFSSVSHRGPRSSIELKATLRRFSQLVLAGYGGASLLFFGVPLAPAASRSNQNDEMKKEEARLTNAVSVSEVENLDPAIDVNSNRPSSQSSLPGAPPFSWWNVLLGRHDQDIILQYANSGSASFSRSTRGPPEIESLPATAQTEYNDLMPRYWVLTDHARREIVLVVRGTMSLNELAVDLTCDPVHFEVFSSERALDEEDRLDAFDEELETIPGSFLMEAAPPTTAKSGAKPRSQQPSSLDDHEAYEVHGGMLKLARAMGNRGRPVHVAVRNALRRNPNYNLVMCGHSLGAGVAALLALMWADPRTCLTHRHSGLPSGRHVSAFCYGPPCLVSANLSRLASSSNLITSFVHSHDTVATLSLGSIRDLVRAAAWLCEAEKVHKGEGYGGVTGRALRWKAGFGKPGDEQWFLSIRKTLEANMQMAHLYPPGRVYWAIRDGDLHPSHRLSAEESKGGKGKDKVRMFEVQDVEKVFGQVVFARDMLSSHMPHQYDRVLHELL